MHDLQYVTKLLQNSDVNCVDDSQVGYLCCQNNGVWSVYICVNFYGGIWMEVYPFDRQTCSEILNFVPFGPLVSAILWLVASDHEHQIYFYVYMILKEDVMKPDVNQTK